MSANIPQVFVDDTDQNIVYSGADSWVAQTGISTTPQPSLLPARAPFYGTRHQVNGSSILSSSSLTYTYRGRDVSAFLINSEDSGAFSFGCMIDGKSMGAIMSLGSSPADQVKCFSEGLQDGVHNITVSTTRNPNANQNTVPPSFDGLFYTRTNATYTSQAQELDLAYTPAQASSLGMLNMTSGFEANTLSVPGDALDFDFNGTSMAIYVTYIHSSNVPVTLSYNVDGGPPINFTLDNPSAFTSASDQLILQTPQYAAGQQHHLHLDFLGPATKQNQALSLDHFFVQNAPHMQELAPFPPLSGATSTAQFLASAKHNAPRTIVTAFAATVLPVLVVFILSVLYFKRRQRALRRKILCQDTDNDSSGPTRLRDSFKAESCLTDQVRVGQLGANSTTDDLLS
ncbi:hypothetical protein CPC08DRAFT_767255 [Agrocybe pediades]|nr:hypothetical protein CPC08DRAFT_767255 [Agrocybe pediades]